MSFAGEQNDILLSNQSFSQQLETLTLIEDNNKSIEYSLQLLEKPSLTPQQIISILQIQHNSYFELRAFDLAISSAKRAQLVASENNLEKISADAYKRIGISYYFKKEFQQAVEAYKASLTFYLNSNDPIQLANLYNNIGLAYIDMGEVEITLENFQLAETLYNKFGSEADQIDIRYNIAGLYLRLKRSDKAIELYLDVIEKLSDSDDKETLAKARGELGTAYKYSGEHKKALNLLQKAIEYFDKEDDTYNSAGFHHNIAGLYNMMGQALNGIKHANEAIRLAKPLGHQVAYAGGLYSLAQAQFSLGSLDEAYENLLLSDEIVQKIGHKEQQNSNMALFSLIYAGQNKPLLAIKTHQEYIKRITQKKNSQLNVQLKDFESEKLKQALSQSEQKGKLQKLQMDQADQKRNFSFVAAAFILVLILFVFTRNIDRRSKLKLSERVKHRTKELELVASELVKANAVKSQFLANMSHEIRTPLTSIIGQAEAIAQGDIDEELLYKEVDVIYGNSLHLLELINNILDLSKVEANKLELELVEQDLHLILHELANMFTKQAKEKWLDFEIVHTLPSPFLIKIDGFRLKQILINLCSNAIKFTSKGSVTVNVSVRDRELRFSIVDTGIGMSETQLREIFDSFTQGDSSISRRFGGSGLGLCLSEQLAKLLGGEISVTSVLNQGSVFNLLLECDQCEHNITSPTSIVANVTEPSTVADHYSGQIVLADDHDDNRRLIARLLSSLGLEVLCASNGREAVELCLDSSPKLILMDIQMPEMDGIEAFKVLRQQGCTQPIIALTANAMSHEVEKYLSLGFDGHLKKPIERKLFIATIAKYYSNLNNENDAEQSLATVDMSDLIIEFKSNLVLEQQDLIHHIKYNELDKLARLAHRIAGAAQMFGFSLISVSAIKLEKNIKLGNSLDISDSAQCLLNEIEQVLW